MSIEHAQAAVQFQKVEITSDGRPGGTEVLINGKSVANLSSLHFSFYPSHGDSGDSGWVSLEYGARDAEQKPGTLAETRHYRLVAPARADVEARAAIQPVEDRVKTMARLFNLPQK